MYDSKVLDVNRYNPEKFKLPIDGVLGLAYSRRIPEGSDFAQARSMVGLMKDQGLIPFELFALALTTDTYWNPGTIEFGNFSVPKRNSGIQWLKVHNNTWMVEVSSVLYNNETVDDGERNFAIFDSSYQGVHLPYSEFDRIAGIL